MEAFVIVTAATVTLALENVASSGTFECEADHQCKSGYCYRETGYCAPCLDCAEYLRQSPQWRTCPRDPKDCGACLPGYENEYLTGGTVRNFCVPSRTLAAEVVNERSPYFWPLVGCGGFLLLVIVCYLTIKKYRVYKIRRDAHNSNPDAEDPPPPTENERADPPPSYDSSIPLLVRNPEVSSAVVTSLTVIEKDENSLLQAVPYTRPHPPYGDGAIDSGDEESDFPEFVEMDQLGHSVNDDDDEIRRVPSPQLEDEDTMPSEWVPDACHANRQSPTPSTSQHFNIPFEELSSSTSSLSNISNGNVDVDAAAGAQVLNDSGVSASCSQQSDLCSQQSDLSSADNVETCGIVLENPQNTTANSMHPVLERCRSDEDMSTLAEIRANKRQRCDSGSSSMKSLEPY